MEKFTSVKEEFFGLGILTGNVSASRHFNSVARTASAFLTTDRFSLSYLPLKTKLIHEINDYSVFARERNLREYCLSIIEKAGVEDEIEPQVRDYLVEIKGLIFTSLPNLTDRKGFENLIEDLTYSINTAERKISKQKNFKEFGTSVDISINEIDLIRLLDKLWKWQKYCGSSVCFRILNLSDMPKVNFVSEPPLHSWVDNIDRNYSSAWFRISTANFDGPDGWRAYLINSGEKKSFRIKIVDPSFWEKMRSSKKNLQNGLLAGDLLYARYWREEDTISKRVTYNLTAVEKLRRADEFGDQPDLPL